MRQRTRVETGRTKAATKRKERRERSVVPTTMKKCLTVEKKEAQEEEDEEEEEEEEGEEEADIHKEVDDKIADLEKDLFDLCFEDNGRSTRSGGRSRRNNW